MGCAKDIVEHCGVPRFLFSDFPLGNSAGKPFDVGSQAATLDLAFRVLESAPGARTTVQSPQRWNDDAAWTVDYNNLDAMTPDELGLGYEVLAKVKPELFDGGLSGCGHTGPEKTTAAFDGKVQAMSGIMSVSGLPEQGPRRVGFAICDTIRGMTAALAVSSALY